MSHISNPLVRRGLIVLGFICVGLGVIGLVVPMMPGVVFLGIAAWCFSKSSERFHEWLIHHKHLGPIVKAWETGEGFTRQLRRRILIILWVSLVISMIVVGKPWVIAMITCVGIGVTTYLMRQPLDESGEIAGSIEQETN